MLPFLVFNSNPPRKSTSIHKKIKKILWVDRKLKFAKVELSKILKILKIFEKIENLKISKFFENTIFRKLLKLLWKSKNWVFEEIRNFQNFEISTLSSFNFRSTQRIFLIFFFLNRSGFSRRIRIHCQKLHHNSLEEMILHSETLGHLTQDSILNIIQFRETTLKGGRQYHAI